MNKHVQDVIKRKRLMNSLNPENYVILVLKTNEITINVREKELKEKRR